MKKGKKVNDKRLQLLTNEVLKELKKFDIVTPELFNSIYVDVLKKLDMSELTDSSKISSNDILKKYYKLQEQTKESVKVLDENAKLAKVAIEEKNDKLLTEVNNKMESLLEKISKLQKQVYLDELTKAYNRKYLFEEVLKDDYFKSDGIITFVDLDKFKHINDTYGHVIGDKVLSMIATLLKELNESSVIRYGGDEFIVISKLPYDEVKRFFEEKSISLSRKSFKHSKDKFKVGFSYGIERFSKDESFSSIVDKVDKAMYEQKKAKKEKEKKSLEVA